MEGASWGLAEGAVNFFSIGVLAFEKGVERFR